jgi:hypothetical protein
MGKTIPFDEAVCEVEKALEQLDEDIARAHSRLGELADRVEKKYGARTIPSLFSLASNQANGLTDFSTILHTLNQVVCAHNSTPEALSRKHL